MSWTIPVRLAVAFLLSNQLSLWDNAQFILSIPSFDSSINTFLFIYSSTDSYTASSVPPGRLFPAWVQRSDRQLSVSSNSVRTEHSADAGQQQEDLADW